MFFHLPKFIIMKQIQHRTLATLLAIWFTIFANPDRVFAQCNALHFDGQNDFVQAASPISGNTDFTLEMWFRSDNTTTGGVCDGNSLADFRWLVGWDDDQFGIGECQGNLRFVFKPACPGGTGLCSSLPTVSIQDGNWHHVAFVKTAASIRILMDGSLLATFGSGAYDLSGFYRLGSSGSGSVGKNWLGAMDELRIWNGARTDAQILKTLNCQLAAAEPGLRTLYRFNLGFPEGPNAGLTKVSDLGPAGEDGELSNFALDGPSSNWTGGPDQICDAYCQTANLGIVPISPIGEVVWAPGEPRTFIWTNAVGYSGLYHLKIKKLAADEEAPLDLPDTGLFYENADIPDSSFTLPGSVPEFDSTARYAWQVETVGTVGGLKVRGPVVVIIALPRGVNLTITGLPTSPLCPGECYTFNALFQPSFPWSFYLNRLTVYTDFDPTVNFTPDVRVSVPGFGGSTMAMAPKTGLLPVPGFEPAHYNWFNPSRPVQICINKYKAGPVLLRFYFSRGSSCNTIPLGLPCLFDIEDRYVTIANVPNYGTPTLSITPQTSNANLTEICSGDPVKFCLKDASGNPLPPATAPTVITWEYSTTGCGGAFSPLTGAPFNLNQFCFGVGPGIMLANCGPGSKGFDDFCYRAKIVVTDPATGKVCTYFSTAYPLRICCPVPKPTVVLNVQPASALNGTLCEGDVVTIDVSLTNPPGSWIPPGPGSVVTIDWCLNGVPISLPPGTTQFTYGPFTVGAAPLCFEVKIKNCACPLVTSQTCIPVSLAPKCGAIVGCHPNLTLISSSPMLCYEICPGKEAAVCMVNPADFMNCIPQWQFSFDNLTWKPLGSTNPIQNTDILPCTEVGSPYEWPAGVTCIYYRICCAPPVQPSGCDPCYSNVIKVCLKPSPVAPVLQPPGTICFGQSVILSTPLQAGVTFTWYCNGINQGNGVNVGLNNEFTATQQAWYWVVADNGCEKVESNHVFLQICIVTAEISCPLFPNECAKQGEEIHLNCAMSNSTCGGPLTFQWTTDGTGSPGTTSTATNLCDFYHYPGPPPAGTVYTLTVTDQFGCTDSHTVRVVPCVP